MRVRFSALQADRVGVLQGADALKEGQEYIVLEVFIPLGKHALFRMEFIEGEDPALFDSRLFTVTSSSLPPSWRYFQHATGSFSLCPEAWVKEGFWEAYYDRIPGTLDVYKAEKREIVSSS